MFDSPGSLHSSHSFLAVFFCWCRFYFVACFETVPANQTDNLKTVVYSHFFVLIQCYCVWAQQNVHWYGLNSRKSKQRPRSSRMKKPKKRKKNVERNLFHFIAVCIIAWRPRATISATAEAADGDARWSASPAHTVHTHAKLIICNNMKI